MQPILQNHTLVQHQRTVGWRLVSTLLLFLLVMFWGLVQAVEDSDYQLSAAGSAVTVHDNTAGEQQGPQSIRLADGGMLVVFWQRIQPDPEVREYDVEITAQPYDSSGNRAGAPIAVVERARHEYNLSEPYTLSAAALSNGGYVIAWHDLGSNQVSMRVYDASHQLVNDQVEIGPLPKRTVRHRYDGNIEVDVLPQQVPVLTAVEDGGFVATFSAYHPQHRNLSEIFYLGGVTAYTQAFTADGQPKSEALQIRPWLDSTLRVSYNWNTWKNWVQGSTALPDGRHVVVFDLGSDQPDNPLENDAIMVRFFDADGVPVSDGFIVNQSNTNYKNYRRSTTVAALAGGRFVVAWEGPGERVWWRLYNAQGNALNEQQRMGEDRYIDPIVNPMPDGGVLLTARRYISSPYGAYADDAYAQRIDADENLVSDVFKVIDAGDDLDRASARVAPAVLWLGDGSIWSVVQATNRDDQGYDVVMLPMTETPLDDGYALSVSTSGHGVLSSTPAGIDCGTTCTANFPANEQVTLTAVADSGYRLDSWGGACAATPASSNSCTLPMDAAQSVSVTFAETTTPNVTLSVSVAGPGLVIGDGIECPNDCTTAYAQGDIITLTAVPDAGATFTGWGGACAVGSDTPICILTMDQARNVTATFETTSTGDDQPLSVTVAGPGSITSVPAGILCGVDCDAEFPTGTRVTLTALPNLGATFNGWGGDCVGTNASCTLTLSQARFVEAEFSAVTADDLPLAVSIVGQGRVQSTPAGIDCTGLCLGRFAAGTGMTLTATPAEGWIFTGWEGACTGAAATCRLDLISPNSTTAKFEPQEVSGEVMLDVVVVGSGSVSSNPAGIDCGNDCQESYPQGDSVTLTATPDTGNSFVGWGGACEDSGSNASCTLNLNEAQLAVAAFSGAVTDRESTDWKVAEIYMATLGYAPDNQGLQYWVTNIDTLPQWTPETVAQSFFDQPLVQLVYPPDQGFGPFIDALYRNIFGRGADIRGYDYWLEQLESGQISRNQMVIAMINGGWGNPSPDALSDMQRFGYRIEVALAFARYQANNDIVYNQLSTEDQQYLREVGRDILLGITTDESTRDAAIDSIPMLLGPLAELDSLLE